MRVHHVAFRTHDLPRLERFYVDVLGLQVKTRLGQRSVWLVAGDAILMLEKAAPDEPRIPPGSMEFFAFAVTEAQKIPLVDRLLALGVNIEHRTEYTVYFRDPDGRRVGLSSFSPRDLL